MADNGPGIPDETDRQRATERFVRLEQSRSQPGSGLGLSLAKAVMKFHGGRLDLAAGDPGLSVVMSFPDARTDGMMASAAAEQREGSSLFVQAAEPAVAARSRRGAGASLRDVAAAAAGRRSAAAGRAAVARGAERRTSLPPSSIFPTSCATAPAAGRKCSTGCSTPTIEERLDAILGGHRRQPRFAEGVTETSLMTALRTLKLEAHFLIALADLAGEADTATTVRRLSDLADACIERGDRFPAARRASRRAS